MVRAPWNPSTWVCLAYSRSVDKATSLPVQTLAVHFHSTSQHQHCLTSAFNSLFQQTTHSLHFGKATVQFQQLESPLRSRCCMGFEPPWLTPRGGTLTREVVEGERMEAMMSS